MVIKKKVVLLGDMSVGKTSLVRRYVQDIFDDAYIATIGTKVTKKVLTISHHGETKVLQLMIWDVLGQHGYTGVQRGSMRNAQAAILVCDITNPTSLHNLMTYWLPLIYEWSWNIPIFVVANKDDLPDPRIDTTMMESTAWLHRQSYPEDALPEEVGMNFGMTSAKTGAGVDEMFTTVAHMLMAAPDRSDHITDSIEAAWHRLAQVMPGMTAPKSFLDWLCFDYIGSDEIVDESMRELRVEMVRAGLDIRNPRREQLELLLKGLAERELQQDEGPVVEDRLARRQAALDRAFP